MVKNPLANGADTETWVQSLGWEDPLEEANGNLLQCSWLMNSMDREELKTAEHTGTYNAQCRLLTQLMFYLHQNS